MKSKYPNQIDTPSELPIVRDNIFEIGSDAINSLRSAIIQIEKTLGINPQGSIGMTVGDRLSQSLDSSGNIRQEAIDAAGFISGPIFDDHISSVAAINESKLKLNFPTQVLQSEISYVSSLIDEIQSQIEQISAKLSAHLNLDALNRHRASSISTTAISNTESSTAIRSIAASNVQDVISSIFSSHINYDGTDISETNNSHSALQIFFDNTSVSNITSDDVQNAIEDLSGLVNFGTEQHQDLFHSNGFSKTAYIYDSSTASYGTIIAEDITSSISQNLGDKPYFEVILDVPLLIPTQNIGIGDSVEFDISDEKTEYQIYKIQYDESNENITGFWLFGTYPENSTSATTRIFLRRHREYNEIGLLATAREQYGLSSSNIVQITNPDAPFLISSKINTSEITSSNRYFDLKINGVTYSFDVYTSSMSTQSIDSVIKAINETVDSISLPILAFRKELATGGIELVIAHNISSSDDQDSTLEIVRSDGAIDSLGFAGYESKVIHGQTGASYYINGVRFSGLLKKLDTSGFEMLATTRIMKSGSSGINFITSGIKKGDVVNIIIATGSVCYEVTGVTTSYITLSSRQLPAGFVSTIDSTSRVIIYDASILVNSLEFLNVAESIGSSLVEVFLDSNRNLALNLILEQESASYAGKSVFSVIDFDNPENLSEIDITFENTDDSCVNVFLEESSDIKKIVGDFNYINLKSNIGNFSCTIFIQDKSALYNYAAGLSGSFSLKIYPSVSINAENNLLIANSVYSNFIGKFDGGINGALFTSKLNFGNLEEKDISTSLMSALVETQISDLRSSGIVFGLEVTSVTDPDGYSSGIYLVSISSGVCYVEGKRFEVVGQDSITSGIDAGTYDKLYVGINAYGEIVFAAPDPNCTYPWAEESTLLLYTIENDGVSFSIIDQRLFINDLDTRILNSITVSPQKNMGHFTDIIKAIKYAKRFSEIYPNAGIPEIKLKAGTHLVSMSDTTTKTYIAWAVSILGTTANTEKQAFYNNLIKNGIFLDFPITIVGEGSSTIVEVTYNLSASDGDKILTGPITIAGLDYNSSGTLTTTPHDTFSTGRISLSNFEMKECGINLVDLTNYSGATDNYLFKVNIENLIFSFENTGSLKTGFNRDIRFYEVSNNTSYKGNVSIKGCVFKNDGCISFNPAYATAPMRYKHIFVEDNETDRVQGISNPSLFDTTYFPSGNNIWSFGNTVTTLNDTYKKDRVSCDLIVPGALVGGSIQSLGNYYFDTTRTFKKTYWFYQGQLIYDKTSAIAYAATDPLVYPKLSSTTRIGHSASSDFTMTFPYVSVLGGEFVSIPIEILNGQTLKGISIYSTATISSSFDEITVSLAQVSESADVGADNLAVSVYTSASTLKGTDAFFDISCNYTPSNDLSHFLVVENMAASGLQCIKAVLTFQADNLFDLLGIS